MVMVLAYDRQPDVLFWGLRTFLLHAFSDGRHIYRECFTVMATTTERDYLKATGMATVADHDGDRAG